MNTVSKRQVIQKLEGQLVKCSTHELHGALIGYRIDPVPITIYADESRNGNAEFQGWILFENAQSDDCIGYCDDPWGEGWSYFRNSLGDTQRGDFSASLFGKSIGEILDQMIALDTLNRETWSKRTQPSAGADGPKAGRGSA